MNHLRELLEALPQKVGINPSWTSHHHALEAFSEVKQQGEQAVCFFIGDIGKTVVSLAVIPELCRLPYPICWFETEFVNPLDCDKPTPVGMLCVEDDEGFYATLYARAFGKWQLEGIVAADSLQNENMRMNWVSDTEAGKAIQTMTYGVKAFLSALHCSNVHRQEHAPDAKLQKARAKRGKAPLFSYWTLQLNGKNEGGDDKSGTHATPRVHLRRGHPRQYAPGKWTWVQAHAVGNRAAGMVHKDYSAGRMLTSLATRSAA